MEKFKSYAKGMGGCICFLSPLQQMTRNLVASNKLTLSHFRKPEVQTTLPQLLYTHRHQFLSRLTLTPTSKFA